MVVVVVVVVVVVSDGGGGVYGRSSSSCSSSIPPFWELNVMFQNKKSKIKRNRNQSPHKCKPRIEITCVDLFFLIFLYCTGGWLKKFVTYQSITLFNMAEINPTMLKLSSVAVQSERPAMMGIRERFTNKVDLSPANTT